MTENNRDIKPDIYAQVKTIKLINDVRPVGESNDDVASIFDELDKRFFELILVLPSDSVVNSPLPLLTVD
jgi:hypothetical protein